MSPDPSSRSGGSGSESPPASDVASLLSDAAIGVVRMTATGQVVDASDALASITGYDPAVLRGQPVSRLLADVPKALDSFLAGDSEGASLSLGVALQTSDGGSVPCDLHLRSGGEDDVVGVVWPRADDRGGAGRSDFHDAVADAADESAPAKAFVALADAVSDGIIVLDVESGIQYANPAVERILGYEPNELVGSSKLAIIPERLRQDHLDAIDRYLETGERHIDWEYVELPGEHKDGHEVPLGISLNDFRFEGDRYFVGLFRNVSAQKEAEQRLATQIAQQEVVAELGQEALETDDLDAFLSTVTRRVAGALDAEFSEVLGLDDAGEVLTLRAATGIEQERVGTVSFPVTESQAGYTLRTEEPVVITDLADDPRIDDAPLLSARGIRSGISAVIGSPEDPWGILGVHDTAAQEFADHDVNFVQTVANVVASAVALRESTRHLEAQRAQLDALNQLNELVNDIQRAVAKQSTREEIEQLVCDGLVERDPYRFAWMGKIDLEQRTLVPVASAGDDESYLAAIRERREDSQIGIGPGGEAIRSGSVRVVDVETDESFRPWRDVALDYGYRTLAAVPIVHDETVFGVLALYSEERDAFGDDVRSVLSSLGESVGHAIAAVNRKRALLSEDVTEAELQFEGYPERMGIGSLGTGRIEFTRVVSAGDDGFLLFGETSTDAVDALIELSERNDRFGDVSIVDRNDDGARFELSVSDSPLIARIVGYGGRIARAVLNDAGFTMTVELPPSTDLATLVEAVDDVYPDVDTVLNQRRTRSRPVTPANASLEGLTERQQSVLETAYFGGYFEWPRENAGEDLAERLGIAGPTFHEHLRSGLRTLLSNVFDDRPGG